MSFWNRRSNTKRFETIYAKTASDVSVLLCLLTCKPSEGGNHHSHYVDLEAKSLRWRAVARHGRHNDVPGRRRQNSGLHVPKRFRRFGSDEDI